MHAHPHLRRRGGSRLSRSRGSIVRARRSRALSLGDVPEPDPSVDLSRNSFALLRRGRAIMDTNRLAKELREIAADTKSGVTVTTLGDNLGHMQGTLQGASRNGARAEPLGSEADRPDFGRLPMPLFRFPVDSSVSRLTRFPSPRSRPEPAQDPRSPRTRAASSTWTSNSRMRTRSSRRRCGS